MPKTAEIKIDMDRECSECGEKGVAQNGLCLKCNEGKITRGLKPPVRIEIERIEDLVLKIKDGGVTVQFDAMISPGQLGRLHLFAKQKAPMRAVIESPQAMFDLRFQEFNTDSGEIREEN